MPFEELDFSIARLSSVENGLSHHSKQPGDEELIDRRKPKHHIAQQVKSTDTVVASYDSIMAPLEPMYMEKTESDAAVHHLQEHVDVEEEATEQESFQRHDVFESPAKLGVIPLAVIVFYSVSGGPFGCEVAVRSGGNLYTLLGFLLMPLVWSLQEAWITAELGSAFPEAAGGVAWVEEAFGTTAAFMSGWMGWLAGATDNAIYPVLFLDYLLQVLKEEDKDIDPILRFCLLAVASIILAYINWLGLPLVGRMSIGICVIAMSPFIILTLVGAFKQDPSRWFRLPSEAPDVLIGAGDDDGIDGGLFPDLELGGVLWRPFLNNLFWNLNSFDAAASFAADIEEPGRVLPTALGWSVLMVTLCYFVPLLVAFGASDAAQHEWVDGYLARVASEVVGPWLGAWTVFAAGISNIALFQAELSADAFQLMGMADRGHLPRFFTKRSRHGTPTYGIIVGTLVIVFMSVSHLDQLIEMLNFNYAISLLMEYCAFLKLRVSRPDLERPYRIPLNTFGCIILFIPTFVFTLLVLMLATYTTFGFCTVTNLVGIFIYMAKHRDVPGKSLCKWGKTYSPIEIEIDSTARDTDTDSELTIS